MYELTITMILALAIVLTIDGEKSSADQTVANPREKNISPFQDASLLDPPSGYMYIDQNEFADLNNLPSELISEARHEFLRRNFTKAGQDLHFAAKIKKLQAEGDLRNPRIKNSANKLEKLSQMVLERKIKDVSGFDLNLTAISNAETEKNNSPTMI